MITIFKRQIVALCMIIVLAIFNVTIYSAEQSSLNAPVKITFDGRELPLRTVAPKIINGVVYTPLRDTIIRLKLNIYWEPDTGLISVFNSQNTLQVNLDTQKAFYNGVSIPMPPSFLYNSTTYISINSLADFFGFELTYCDNGVNIYSTAPAREVINLNKSYEVRKTGKFTSEDIFWMSKIIHAEAKGESFEAKLAVGNVVLNRKEYDEYPNSIKEIIFDRKSGIQFTPIINGSIYSSPCPDSVRAAIESLNGKNNAKNALFFINPDYASSSWVSDNRIIAFKIENHTFYY